MNSRIRQREATARRWAEHLLEKIPDDASLRRVQDVPAAIRHGGCLLEEITEAEYWSIPPGDDSSRIPLSAITESGSALASTDTRGKKMVPESKTSSNLLRRDLYRFLCSATVFTNQWNFSS
jgi:hypothetical protein